MDSSSFELIRVESDQAVDQIIIRESLVELAGPIYKLILSGESYFIREGTWLEKDDNGDFQPDWSLTWIYKDKDNPEDYVYYEQDPKDTAVYNFLKVIEDTR